ncbi:MAG: lipase [Clostridia bacterium]|nr:lipase [Clostridia bacterium]
MFKALVSLWVSFVMLFMDFVPGFVPPEKPAEQGKTYPYVFVHGFLGWGRDEGINKDIPYWGATACYLIDELNDKGYDCYDASVGPFSSAWDRACELYAQLTGTRVDYGEAHSALHNHLRYGRTYDEPLVKGWGETDKNGEINKINLIGHSFGGNTIRLFTELMANGDKEELAATDENDISPFFTGGKSNWINSLVTICTPHNGTTLEYIVEGLHLIPLTETILYLYAGLMGRSFLNGYLDFHLEQFGLTYIPGDNISNSSIIEAIRLFMSQKTDDVEYDLSPDGCAAANERIGISDDVYYFSYPFCSTFNTKIDNSQLPLPSTLFIINPFAAMMGNYFKNRISDYIIDKTWRPNDGLVNVVSSSFPEDDPHQDYDPKNIEKGIWNVMPLSRGDHGNAIGIGVRKDYLVNFYDQMLSMIDSLPAS